MSSVAARESEYFDIAPDDVVGAIFAYSELRRFPSSKEFIHKAFYRFFNEHHENYPELFDEFIFSEGTPYPYSALLERVLLRLQVSRIILANNPTYRNFIIEESSAEFLKANAEKRLANYEELLKALGKLFAESASSYIEKETEAEEEA